MNPISVISNVYNEEQYLENAYSLLRPHVDEFVMIDQGSTDRTVEIARRFTDKVFSFPRVYYSHAYIHQAALMARNEWVLKCDPDERWDERILSRLPEFISSNNDVFRFYVHYGGDMETMGIRLWRKSKVLFTDSFDPLIYNAENLKIIDVKDGFITNLRDRKSAPERYRIEGARRLLERYGDTEIEPYRNFCLYYRDIIDGKFP